MSYAAHKHLGFPLAGQPRPEVEAASKKRGILRRMFDAFMESRQREAERQIARFLAGRSDGALTDALEREIAQRLSTSNWSVNGSPFGDRRFP